MSQTSYDITGWGQLAGVRERMVSDRATGEIHFEKSQRSEKIIDTVHELSTMQTNAGTFRHIGSIPLIVGQQWAKECGAGIGTAEWNEYAKKKLMSGDFAKLMVQRA